jgi:ATP-dependent Clp protease ATP-binding subunit ClpC
MTSNVGAHTIRKQKTLGFAQVGREREDAYDKMKDNVMDELKRSFRPEFLNRIDDIIVFHQLEEKDVAHIVRLMLDTVIKRLEELEIKVDYTDEVISHLSRAGFDEEYGARPLRRAITKMIEDKLSEEMLRGEVKKGDEVLMDIENENVVFKQKIKH